MSNTTRDTTRPVSTYAPAAQAITSLAALAPHLPVPWELAFRFNQYTGEVAARLNLDTLDQFEAWAQYLGHREEPREHNGRTHYNADGVVAGVAFDVVFIDGSVAS